LDIRLLIDAENWLTGALIRELGKKHPDMKMVRLILMSMTNLDLFISKD